MSAIMVVHMKISDPSWIEAYFTEVPKLLSEYGARSLAGSRNILRVEGSALAPDRIAILSFPSLEAIECFLADKRYEPFRRLRESGSSSEIFVFENAIVGGELV